MPFNDETLIPTDGDRTTSGIGPTCRVCGGVGDLGAAVAVGGGLSVGVDLDSLQLLGNPCSWRKTEAFSVSYSKAIEQPTQGRTIVLVGVRGVHK